jgi:hypothetical protein
LSVPRQRCGRRRAQQSSRVNPNGVIGTAAFGTITSAGDPRVIQLSAKIVF